MDYKEAFMQRKFKDLDPNEYLALYAVEKAFKHDSQIIICLSKDPSFVKTMSQMKSQAFILCPHFDKRVITSLTLFFGVIPIKVSNEEFKDAERVLRIVESKLGSLGLDKFDRNPILVNADTEELRLVK